MENLYSVNTVAKICGVKPQTIYRWVKNSQISYVRHPGGGIRFTEEQVQLLKGEVDNNGGDSEGGV